MFVLQADVLDTLGGYHLLDAWRLVCFVLTRPELVQCSERDHNYEDCCVHPMGDREEQL
jgi:hypothetical protein